MTERLWHCTLRGTYIDKFMIRNTYLGKAADIRVSTGMRCEVGFARVMAVLGGPPLHRDQSQQGRCTEGVTAFVVRGRPWLSSAPALQSTKALCETLILGQSLADFGELTL